MEAKKKLYDEIKFNDFNEFVSYLNGITYPLCYRGIGNYDYLLESKLTRFLTYNHHAPDTWYFQEIESINFFKRHFKTVVSQYPEEDDIYSWLCLMQHYGAPTRLIDFTRSVYVALYFAYENIHHEKGGALWILNPDLFLVGVEEKDYKLLMQKKLFNVEYVRANYGNENLLEDEKNANKIYNLKFMTFLKTPINILFPATSNYPDNRMIVQQGCFMIQGNLSFPLDSFLLESKADVNLYPLLTILRPRLNDLYEKPDLNFFTKIYLEPAWKHSFQKLFNKMNLNGAALFPGIAGIGRATEDHLNTKYYFRTDFNQ